MVTEWRPSVWGRLIARAAPWRLRLTEQMLELLVDGQAHAAPLTEASPLHLRRGMVWTTLTLDTPHGRRVRVRGLPNRMAQELEAALAAAVLARGRIRQFKEGYARVKAWMDEAFSQMKRAETQRRWFTSEQQQALLERKSHLGIDAAHLQQLLKDAGVAALLADGPDDTRRHLRAWDGDWPKAWSELNERHVQRELAECRELFDRLESRPLSEEQARAATCFDNRVLVVAAAGSGKTSTMVAKAAYAVHRGIARPERIVLLAFNKRAADELQRRADQAFERVGMADAGVEASTFHALGLRIIAKATGTKPDVPNWAVDPALGIGKLTALVDGLKDGSSEFRTNWDMFRTVFRADLPPFGAPTQPDAWDRDGKGYIRTLRGERVRSREECIIADWLFYNGVNYEYERPYAHATANAHYRQYRPDFYYPDIDLYHEHFALDAQGRAPAAFDRYEQGVAWKRELHRARGTHLIETASHQLRSGTLLAHLARELSARGIVLAPNPDRPVPPRGKTPVATPELVGLIRTFISHAKSNGLSPAALRQRVAALPESAFNVRYRMFLDIALPVMAAWDAALAADGGIDFEDMLNAAARHLETSSCDSPFDVVLADEFQDASNARARLCRALVRAPGRHLCAVGDDWQSINRYAGADLSVMTRFHAFFGPGQTLKLERTFRCPQALCDLSSRFVSKNPAQIGKAVRSDAPSREPVVQAFEVAGRAQLSEAIDDFLRRLCERIRRETHAGTDATQPASAMLRKSRPASAEPSRKCSVFVLGRYHSDAAYLPTNWRSRYGKWLELGFLSIHLAKGSEADYVILPAMLGAERGLGFPDTRQDDPVLALAMPSADAYPDSEERRLFYVALTRARRSVALFTVKGERSRFLRELVSEHRLTVTMLHTDAQADTACPACGQGVIVTRTGAYGDFACCSNYPACEYKPAGARRARA
ncbi:AAA family ATPase [Verticiella sediminum]|uniref:DNA 3'-5' helicase n=1 Tax=Verticiella sediminum TaxID=1247510 RepID=A0A556ATQ5_9BURK|nr:AAA family ATPase [Verticiella sediminum]